MQDALHKLKGVSYLVTVSGKKKFEDENSVVQIESSNSSPGFLKNMMKMF